MAANKNNFGQGPEMLREPWLHHFVEKTEKAQLVDWMRAEGLERPREFDARVEHAGYLKKLGNDWHEKGDFRRALHCTLGAIHCLDFCPLEQEGQSESQRRQVAEAMLPTLCNFTQIFLKRGDFFNADKAATSGLLCAQKLPEDAVSSLRAKLFYRRALARAEKGDQNNLEGSRSDLIEAARLDPGNREIRNCLNTCNELLQKERRDTFQNGPRYEPPLGKKSEESKGTETQQDEVQADQDPSELSPALEFVAMCVGKSLRRIRKCWLMMHRLFEWSRAKVSVLGWLFTIFMLCLNLGFARYAYVATEGTLTSRVFLLSCCALVIAFLVNVLGMQLLGTSRESRNVKRIKKDA